MDGASSTSLTVRILGESAKAYRITDGDKTAWLPKSKVELTKLFRDGTVEITIPEWLAIEKELA